MMSTETERKFLVRSREWKADGEGVRYRQGYLTTDPACVVRVRMAGENGFLTVKGKTRGFSRLEFEYEIPADEAAQMLNHLCKKPLIEKVRYQVEYAGYRWEIDVFEGENRGLVLAEIELTDPAEPFSLPDWVGEEVSHDPRYFNVNLVNYPYVDWGKR